MVSSPQVADPSSTFLRDALLIAGFDLRESLRTRRALVLALLYLLVSAATSYGYVQVIRIAEEAAQEMLAQAGGAGDPAVAAAGVDFMQDQGYRGLLYVFAGGDGDLVGHLATYPPMVLVFAYLSLGFLPWLIALTSYDMIAGELHLRTVRFIALRTTRGAFVVGKLLSQLALVAAIAALATVPVLVFGAAYLRSFDLGKNFLALVQTWPILALFAFAILGPVALASQLVKGPGAARALAILLLFGQWIVSAVAMAIDDMRPFSFLTPFHYKTWFFYPGLVDKLLAAAVCVAMCAGYTWLGFQIFRRRDL